MQKTRMKFFIAILGSVLSFSLYAKTAWMIAPSIAYYQYANKRHLDAQVLPNLQLGYQLNDQYNIRVLFGKLKSDYHHHAEKYHVSGEIYTFDVIRYFTQQALKPYLLGGLGAIHLRPHRLADNDVAVHVDIGAGFAYSISPKIHLNLDVRDFYTFMGGANDVMLNFGVNFLFFNG